MKSTLLLFRRVVTLVHRFANGVFTLCLLRVLDSSVVCLEICNSRRYKKKNKYLKITWEDNIKINYFCEAIVIELSVRHSSIYKTFGAAKKKCYTLYKISSLLTKTFVRRTSSLILYVYVSVKRSKDYYYPK